MYKYLLPLGIIAIIIIAFYDTILAGLIWFGIGLAVFGAGAGIITLYVGWQRAQAAKEERLEKRAKRIAEENKAAIITTQHGDYLVRAKDLHVAQLSDNPLLDWNGAPREITPAELAAWGIRHRGKGADSLIIDQQAQPLGLPAPTLPQIIQLADILPGMRGNLESLILGQKVTPYGLENVTISIYDLFHTIAAGSTGWGKSAFINCLLLQMATALDLVEFVLIDQQDHGLAAFRNCDRLRYPLLRQPGEIMSALAEVHKEAIGKRSELFSKYDADNLEEYNRYSGDYLPPVIIAVDEASALLSSDKDIGAQLKRQAWELRKFGVYQFLMLTSAKGTTIDTDHRQQFASKVQLHVNDKAQARILGMDATEALSFPAGRAMIELPRREPVIVQTPYVDKRTVRSFLRPGVVPAGPVVIEQKAAMDSQEAEWVRLVKEGYTKSEACWRVFERAFSGPFSQRLNRLLSSSSGE